VKPFEIIMRPVSRLRFYIGSELSKRRYRNFRPRCTSDAMVFGFADNIASLAGLFDRGNMDVFFKRFAELMVKLSAESLTGKALFLPELDELTRRASLVIGPSISSPIDPKRLIHVATQVYPTGGHTRVIEDVAALLPDYRHELIITSMHSAEPHLVSLRPRFDELGLNVHLLHAASPVERAKELSSLIGALGAETVLLLAHPDDLVANVGVARHSAPRVLFMHHADHRPSLGASRTDYAHVDLTPGCHRVCRSLSHLQASLLNLTAKDIGTVHITDRLPIFGVTCGSPQKYEGSSEFTYAQLLAALFSAGVDRILHIGDMPTLRRDQIRTDIAAAGQDRDRVLFLPNTPSLAAKLVEISPDFYLTSHPLGSGKAAVEAMSVGLPIMYVCPASTPPLLNPDMTFATSVPVSALEQIPEAVHRLEREKDSLAKRSRAIYDKHYSEMAFREGLLSVISTGVSVQANPV
jgi:hypothetical protein